MEDVALRMRTLNVQPTMALANGSVPERFYGVTLSCSMLAKYCTFRWPGICRVPEMQVWYLDDVDRSKI